MSVLTFVPGNIWLLSQHCYGDKPLLTDSVDRRRWMYWLFQARRRFGLSVLNYVVLPNKVNLLVMDRRRGEIRSSLPFLADAMAKDYHQRHQQPTPLWEDDYQAMRLNLDVKGLGQCLSDMDVSVVCAKVAAHPKLWPESGYHELLYPPKRARRVDFTALQRLLNPIDFSRLQSQRTRWVRQAMNLIESDAVYAPHSAVLSHAIGATPQPLKLLHSKTLNSLPLPMTVLNPELVPKRYIT